MLYITLVCIAVFVTPSSNTVEVLANWSPMWLNRPYLSSSIRSLWSSHWHSTLRPALSVLAYEPAEALVSPLFPSLGRPAGLLGAFLLSGIIHEIGFYPAARFVAKQEQSLEMTAGFGAGSFGTTRFFLLCAVAVIIETWFKEYHIERHLAKLLCRRKEEDVLIKNRWLRATLARLWTAGYILWTIRLFLDVSIRLAVLPMEHEDGRRKNSLTSRKLSFLSLYPMRTIQVWWFHGACQGPWSFRWTQRTIQLLVPASPRGQHESFQSP